MKNSIGILFMVIAMFGCKQEQDYKKVRDEVMVAHDVVMGDQGMIIKNEMRLKELLKNMETLKLRFPAADTLKERSVMTGMLKNLEASEEHMNDWMHEFEPDITGKSNEQAVQYFKAEQVKVTKMDSVFKAELKASDAYLAKYKTVK